MDPGTGFIEDWNKRYEALEKLTGQDLGLGFADAGIGPFQSACKETCSERYK